VTTGPEYAVVLAGPKFQGNMGLVARLMKNFGLKDLRLVEAPPLRAQAWKRAMHGRDILSAARFHSTLKEALKDIDYIVGTTGIPSRHDKKHLRNAVTPKDFARMIGRIEGKVALLFGREDLLVNIPTDPEYPILNISHAVAIVLYELFQPQAKPHIPQKASGFEKEVAVRRFRELLEVIGYPEYKKPLTEIMFRRIMGRATLSEWEFYTLMGVFSKAIRKAKMGKAD
jgi:TrmH family RNA methyltransferase